jgi:hypothetical protein
MGIRPRSGWALPSDDMPDSLHRRVRVRQVEHVGQVTTHVRLVLGYILHEPYCRDE